MTSSDLNGQKQKMSHSKFCENLSTLWQVMDIHFDIVTKLDMGNI